MSMTTEAALRGQTNIAASMAGSAGASSIPRRCISSAALLRGRREAQQKKHTDRQLPLWPYSHSTAFRRIKEVMAAADLHAGPHLTPKGLRHSYGVHAITSGVPLNMLQKWLGHATMETTAIYADAVGEEEQTIAARMWRSSQM